MSTLACGCGRHTYAVWVEIEELDDDGEHVADHSAMLKGGRIATFHELVDAVEFGDRLQAAARLLQSAILTGQELRLT